MNQIKKLPIILLLISQFCLLFSSAQSTNCPVKDSLVPVLPFFEGNTQDFPCSYSGFINVKAQSGLFYWYFYNEENPDLPMTLWLNGGPGASSMAGLFDENGPLEIVNVNKKGLSLKVRENNWLQYGHLLYVDQPVGTGFSYTKDGEYIGTEDEVAQDFIKFLEGFVSIHTETADMQWNFFGESYGGKYTPAISQAILRSTNPPIQLNKIALIDPLVFGLLQKTSTRNELYGGLGIMDPQQLYQFNSLQQKCAKGINADSKDQTQLCVTVEDYMENQTQINDLNISQNPIIEDYVDQYFNQQPYEISQKIVQSLHIENSSKKSPKIFGSDPQVYQAFSKTNDIYGNESLSQIYEIMYTFERPLMIMEGVFDSLDGILGPEFYKDYLVSEISNRQQIKYVNSQGECASYGYIQQNQGTKDGKKFDFKLVAVQDAGHMIPKDQLLASNFILDNYYNDGQFCDEQCDCTESTSTDLIQDLLNECNGQEYVPSTQSCKCGKDYFLADCSQKITKISVKKPLIDQAKLGWNYYMIQDIQDIIDDGNNVIAIGRNQGYEIQVAYYTFVDDENYSQQEPLSVQYYQQLQEIYIHIDEYKKNVANILGVYLKQDNKSQDIVRNKINESILIQAQFQNYSTDFKEHYFLIKGVGGFCFFICLLLVGIGFFVYSFNLYNKTKKQYQAKNYTVLTD